MDSLVEQLRYACDQVRRLRLDVDSKTLFYWYTERDNLLDQLSARLKARA